MQGTDNANFPKTAVQSYGYFDDSAREYVITTAKTPRKWINYIGSMDFGGFVDQTGGALLCKGDPGLNRITKYFSQTPAFDFKGETLYLRMLTSEGFRTWSPYFTPCLIPYSDYRCQVGLGYSIIRSTTYDVQSEITILVPPGSACELRRVRIVNTGNRSVHLDAIPLVEYSHFDALKQLTNADWVPQTMQSKAIQQITGEIILKQCAFMKNGEAENYLTASIRADSFETDRYAFLGDHEYYSWATPGSLQQCSLSNSIALNGDNIGALLLPLGDLLPGEKREFIIQVGQVDHVEHELGLIKYWNDPKNFIQAQEDLQIYWRDYLEKVQIESPDPAFNSMINIHNPRQCQTTRTWSRYLSLYQLGYGSRGMGFRDSAQDVMAVFASIPESGKELLQNLLSVQRSDGSAYHQYFPLSMEASEGDSLEYVDRPHYYSDDHLWAVLAVCQFIKETGDSGFLQQQIPFYLRGVPVDERESSSVLDHLVRAVTFTHGDIGQHSLPLLGFADWNDTINLPAGAESILTACLYGKALLELMDLLRWLGNHKQVDQFAAWYGEIKNVFQKTAWDGDWFRSYFDAAGTPLGSKENQAGQIIAYGQAWPVIAGFASEVQSIAALNSLRERLNTSNGIKLSAPGFDHYDREKGGITTYPPGAKENGGIFLHVNPWVVIAETIMGRGDQAYAYYSQINPARKNDQLDRYQIEPYVYAQNILGDEHPQFGMGRNSWLSGTASWMYQAGTQYILGIRPEFGGLRIDPCIPSIWEKINLRRWFRGAWYQIQIENPHGKQKGVRNFQVDGTPSDGNMAPIFGDGQNHLVRAILG